MADRPIDRLLPTALALVCGTIAAAAGIAGVAADAMIGRPSSTSGVGLVLMFPLVILSAVVGFATGHMIGSLLRRRGFAPVVAMRPYRAVMTLVLGLATVTGATIGARPVLRHQRLHQPRIILGTDALEKIDGPAAAPDACAGRRPAALACNSLSGVTTHEMIWNGNAVTLGCTREGRLTIADEAGGVTASADLSRFEYLRDVRVAPARQRDGRESLALLAGLRATGRREMFLLFDADGRLIYQELLERQDRGIETSLAICPADDRDAIIIDTGTRITYRPT